MTVEKIFKERVTVRIWDHYFKRADKLTRALSKTQKSDLVMEMKDHLAASFQEESGKTEPERLLNAIEKMGDPEDFIKPMIADILLSDASRYFNPRAIVMGLYNYVFGGLIQFVISLVYVIGYLFAVMFGLMAILKPFFPAHIGFWTHEKGSISTGILLKDQLIFGFGNENSPIVREVLGYWVIPIGLILCVLLYSILTRTLKLLKKKHGSNFSR